MVREDIGGYFVRLFCIIHMKSDHGTLKFYVLIQFSTVMLLLYKKNDSNEDLGRQTNTALAIV